MPSLKATLLLALPILSAALEAETLEAETQVKLLEGPCTVFIEIIDAEVDDEKLVCEAEGDGMMYDVPQVDKAWIEEKRQSGELVSGQTVLDLPENTMVDMQTWSLILSGPPDLLN